MNQVISSDINDGVSNGTAVARRRRQIVSHPDLIDPGTFIFANSTTIHTT
jgi:hypothetical protein